MALLASVPVTALFYVDQNVTQLLLQQPAARLAKESYYHQNFLFVGCVNAIGPLFGLTLITGSLPHSPQFAKALSKLDPQTGRVLSVTENRISPMLMYAAIGASLLVRTRFLPLPPPYPPTRSYLLRVNFIV
eukprot:COSAG01_NODE_19161_length_1027_cov_0.801724_1_plen_131_part_10